jgi:transposase
VTTYSEGFKARLIQRIVGPEGISASALSREVGIGQPTLSRWVRQARTLARMNKPKKNDPTPPKSPRQWTAEEKLNVVLEAAALPEEALGAFLRRRGLHEAQLAEWRALVNQAATEALRSGKKKKPPKNTGEAKRIKQLERELRRKEKALAEVAALLALKKKVEEIWGDGDDDTSTKSET